ncbi:ATP-binding protein [Streptomyces sp. NBC_01013]|uniref:ATP-binding protein n=1 Tax=Streptomyces sp. NBC_01013 TaxID=2903718 RepID=UPI0038643B60|nr:ATP-binding protein [Streptomyces sp. NBC_01013]
MSTTRQHPPGDLGREPEGAGADARADAGARADARSGVPSVTHVEPTEWQWRTLPLREASGIVPTARDFARQALHDWGWLPAATADRRAAAEDVLLVVSELVTNACLHADGPDELRIARTPKALRVEVADGGAGQPTPRTPHRAGRPGGHGMFIVQRLCLDWGVVRVPGEAGKTVWAELAAPA